MGVGRGEVRGKRLGWQGGANDPLVSSAYSPYAEAAPADSFIVCYGL